MLVVTLLLAGAVAGAVALSVVNSQPAATQAPGFTNYPGFGGSVWPTFPASPTPAPAQVGGNGGGKGDHGGGNGKGKGH